MTIRISTEAGNGVTTVRIEGQLTGADVADVGATCESTRPPLRLDLSGLSSADRKGIRLLQSLSEAGVKLHGTNLYIDRLLIEARKKD